MALVRSLARLGAGALALAHQRLELAALDVEEELVRCGQLLVRAFAMVLLAALALAALAAALTLLAPPTARVAVLLAIALAFGAAAYGLARRLQAALDGKPRLLAATLEELREDTQRLQPRGDA